MFVYFICMRIIAIVMPLLMCGCSALIDLNNSNKINESNYMKTPCVWDGTIVEKKPKVNNLNETN